MKCHVKFGLFHYHSYAAFRVSGLPCVAHPDATAKQPLDAKPIDQKQDIIIPSPDDPRMLEACENHERGPILVRLHLGHYEPQLTVIITSVGRLTQPRGRRGNFHCATVATHKDPAQRENKYSV